MANQTFHGGINAPSVNGITPAQAAKLAALADAINVSGNLVCFLGDVFAPSFQPPNTWEDADFMYHTTSGNAVTITALTSTGYNKETIFGGALIIPSTIGGNPVTSIWGVVGGTNLVSVTVPASVTSVERSSAPTSNYTTLYYQGTLTQWCGITGLENLIANQANAISVYIDGAQITGTLSIPSGVTTIPAAAFNNTSQAFNGVTSIVIPDTVTTIGNGAFYASKATSLMLGSGLTSIGNATFGAFDNLTSVTIPASVTNIGYIAFEQCTSLTAFNYAGTMAQWSEVTLGDYWNDLCPFTEVVCSDGTVSV